MTGPDKRSCHNLRSFRHVGSVLVVSLCCRPVAWNPMLMDLFMSSTLALHPQIEIGSGKRLYFSTSAYTFDWPGLQVGFTSTVVSAAFSKQARKLQGGSPIIIDQGAFFSKSTQLQSVSEMRSQTCKLRPLKALELSGLYSEAQVVYFAGVIQKVQCGFVPCPCPPPPPPSKLSIGTKMVSTPPDAVFIRVVGRGLRRSDCILQLGDAEPS